MWIGHIQLGEKSFSLRTCLRNNCSRSHIWLSVYSYDFFISYYIYIFHIIHNSEEHLVKCGEIWIKTNNQLLFFGGPRNILNHSYYWNCLEKNVLFDNCDLSYIKSVSCMILGWKKCKHTHRYINDWLLSHHTLISRSLKTTQRKVITPIAQQNKSCYLMQRVA